MDNFIELNATSTPFPFYFIHYFTVLDKTNYFQNITPDNFQQNVILIINCTWIFFLFHKTYAFQTKKIIDCKTFELFLVKLETSKE